MSGSFNAFWTIPNRSRGVSPSLLGGHSAQCLFVQISLLAGPWDEVCALFLGKNPQKKKRGVTKLETIDQRAGGAAGR
ncbi:hypothetical protein [Variovorax sp. Sphag1AA]|uniref:hypothetical protein n=1 Tax=Variovorax sp. Sphag1AA TaxID=2587027 RepID=UPI00161D8498|nr:hypothetical protein [Variovorax sp. Sphag1AA]MBB3179803.1 hypothetical protein [Variovorax sp. Sphag1AA]